MHIRKPQKRRTNYVFLFGYKPVNYCDEYKYLGLTINEFLNFDKSTEIFADPAGRALGFVITKMIKNGGFPANVYRTVVEACVFSISDYAGEVWGAHEYSFTKRLHSRAIRAFLGLPKNTPGAGLLAEMNWLEPRSRTQVKVVRQYQRMIKMNNKRLTQKVLLWDRKLSEEFGLKTWFADLKNIALRNGISDILQDLPLNIYQKIDHMKLSLLAKDQTKWAHEASSLPKLRSYIGMTSFVSLKAYIFKPLSFIQRKFLAKFRLGVIPLRIETGRYERPKIPAAERTCKVCNNNTVEDEIHFLLYCPKLNTLRETLIARVEDPNFDNLNNLEKLNFLTTDPDTYIYKAPFLPSFLLLLF